jgi:hypothetical protein
MSSAAELAAFAAVCERDPGDGQQVELASQVLGAKEHGDKFWIAVASQLTLRAAAFLDYHFGATCADLRAAIHSTMTPAELAAVVQDREPSWQIQPDTRWNPEPAVPVAVEPLPPAEVAGHIRASFRAPGDTGKSSMVQHALRGMAGWDKQQVDDLRELLTPDERAYTCCIVDTMLAGVMHGRDRADLRSVRQLLLIGITEERAAELIAGILQRWRCGPHHVTD